MKSWIYLAKGQVPLIQALLEEEVTAAINRLHKGGDFPWRGNLSPIEPEMLVGSCTPASRNYPRSESSL